MTDRCPNCGHDLTPPKPKGRICFDCKEPIRAKHKWMLADRSGVQVLVHRHCGNPESHFALGGAPIAPTPLFDAEAAA